eukprot:CAMPEP_0174908574 /NCGR_PEP_ID=MMETSP0167-20121228/65265_1 /TAXON_ID=38298 /ORGANISM="Rhodella maculata, Strain CCMP736" /LENGTH=31 /DNA_ID= /DNA_START= /DNA_END= /DNA_ORIENTATION=
MTQKESSQTTRPSETRTSGTMAVGPRLDSAD